MKKIKWEKWEDFFDKDDDSPNGKVVIPTPIGIISHKIGSKANGDLDFYVGNTNFDLDGLHMSVIKNVIGVEISSLLTPYRFRICVGRAFNVNKVKKDIAIAVGCRYVSDEDKLKLTQEQKSDIIVVKKSISKYRFWAIYILPNGKFEYFGTDDDKEFIRVYQFFHGLEGSVGGRLLSPTKDKMVY